MGILKAVSVDIEDLVKMGYTDTEISKSVGLDKNVIQYIIDHFRDERNYEFVDIKTPEQDALDKKYAKQLQNKRNKDKKNPNKLSDPQTR